MTNISKISNSSLSLWESRRQKDIWCRFDSQHGYFSFYDVRVLAVSEIAAPPNFICTSVCLITGAYTHCIRFNPSTIALRARLRRCTSRQQLLSLFYHVILFALRARLRQIYTCTTRLIPDGYTVVMRLPFAAEFSPLRKSEKNQEWRYNDIITKQISKKF